MQPCCQLRYLNNRAPGDVADDGNYVLSTSTEFSATCGCDDDDTDSSTTPVADGACAAGESFLVSSSARPDIEGCYADTNFEVEDEIIYTITGSADYGQMWMFAYANDTDTSTVSC